MRFVICGSAAEENGEAAARETEATSEATLPIIERLEIRIFTRWKFKR